MVDQLSSEIIDVVSISIQPEDNATIFRYAQLAFLNQRIEE